jgi:hypothetical protein
LTSILAIAILSAIYLYLRNKRSQKIKLELERPLYMIDGEESRFSKIMDKWGLTAGVAGITIYDAVYSISLVDENVLRALDFSSAADLSNFHDIIAHIKTNFRDGSGLNGSLERLEGYTAEQVVAAHLVAKGHVVEFPENSNQQGYDLLVDGYPVQVKNTMTPDLIREHLEKYPDIPVIANSEMGIYFVGNENVIIDPELSHDEIAAAVRHTLDGVDTLDAAPTHIPLVTLVLSCIKESSLLLDQKTDIRTAGKHVLCDTASVGLGGAVCGKIGTVVGSFLGPVGAGVGLVVGGTLGALGGKMIAKLIKQSGYEKKQVAYESALVEVGATLPEVIDKKKELLNTKMNRATKTIKIPWWDSIWPSREAYIVRGLRKLYEQAMMHLDEAKMHLKSLTPVEAGKEAYKMVARGGYYDPRLMEAMRKVNLAYDELLKEMRKLGMA